MRLVYLAHPYGGDPANLSRARRWLRWACQSAPARVAPMAPWILMCELFPGEIPAEVERESARQDALVARCDELWLVGGRISPSMRREVAAALEAGVAIKDFTGLGAEPPA